MRYARENEHHSVVRLLEERVASHARRRALDSPQQTQRDWLFSQEEAWTRSGDSAKEQPLEQPPQADVAQEDRCRTKLRRKIDAVTRMQDELKKNLEEKTKQKLDSMQEEMNQKLAETNQKLENMQQEILKSFSSTPRPSATMRDTGAE